MNLLGPGPIVKVALQPNGINRVAIKDASFRMTNLEYHDTIFTDHEINVRRAIDSWREGYTLHDRTWIRSLATHHLIECIALLAFLFTGLHIPPWTKITDDHH